MARLFVLSGNSIGSTFDVDGTAILGRGGDVDVVIPESSVSRRHARLVPQPEAGVWKIIDLDSSNGVHVEGRRVTDAIVRDGDTFMIGNVELRLRDRLDDEAGAAADAPRTDSAEADAPEAGRAEADGPGAGAEIELELEYGDAIDRELTRPPSAHSTQVRARPAPSAAPARPGATAARPAADPNRPVLRVEAPSRGRDLSQLPGWMRLLLVLLVVGLALGIAYGAFSLTRTMRGQNPVLAD